MQKNSGKTSHLDPKHPAGKPEKLSTSKSISGKTKGRGKESPMSSSKSRGY